MRYLSLFSGIEAASVAWHPLGWQPVAFAEIEPFPCAVLAHHYPDVPNLGDVTGITDEQIAALGNSMAVPVMRWIGQKIDAATDFEHLEKVA